MSSQKPGLRASASITLGALGVVYGDIGTSPIYAFNESIKAGGVDKSSIFGVLSLVLWTLILVVSVKYLLFVVRADNKGEGGILALFTLLPQRIKNAQKGKYALVVFLVFVAAAFLFADGLLTPAISVVSAMEGMKTINPGLEFLVVPLSLLILAGLFAVQFKGTDKIGKIFGPVMAVWFITIGALGAVQTINYPEIFQAINPIYAIQYISHANWHIFVVLSCVILSATGAEALYADLGHFGKRPIRIGWFGVAGLTLVLCYFGQAALILQDPALMGNAFFGLAGDGIGSILLVVLATLATIIASQALISGVASISSQAIQLTLLPRMKIKHTNAGHIGQIYVPFINALLALGSIALVLVFQTSAALAGAYTFAISGTMLITTICVYWVAKETWKLHSLVLYPTMAFFLVIDLAFVISTSTKLITGAWLPLLIGISLAATMWIWRKGRHHLGLEMVNTQMLMTELEKLRDSGSITVYDGIGFYMSARTDTLPQALHEQVRLLKQMPSQVVVVTVKPVDVPYAETEPEFIKITNSISKVIIENGFMESRSIPQVLRHPSLKTKFEEEKGIYFVTDRTLIHKENFGLNHSEEILFTSLHRNAAKASLFFNLPEDRVMAFDIKMNV
jgi:KUP system potassium uptake protein